MLLSLVSVMFLSASCHSETDITKGPPTHDKPWVPAWGYNKTDPTLWQKKHLAMVQQTEQHKQDEKVVFFGDSKTHYWVDVGKEWWHKYYENRSAYNYGIRGDSTRQILWRMEHKELDGLSPELLVFMIGGNNFADNYNRGTDEEIVKAMLIIMDKLKVQMANTTILFVGQLPRITNDKRAKNINHLLEQHYKTKPDERVHFVNYYDKYTHSDGKQNKELYVSDGIHLSSEGYKLLAECLEPMVSKLLNE